MTPNGSKQLKPAISYIFKLYISMQDWKQELKKKRLNAKRKFYIESIPKELS